MGRVFLVGIGTEKKFADDYSFEFGGKIYHVNKQIKEYDGFVEDQKFAEKNAICVKRRGWK